MAERLARIAKVSLTDLGRELFSGSNDSKSAEELLRSDFKEFHIAEQVLGVGQVTCIDSQSLMERKDELLGAMRRAQKANSYDMVILMLTDVRRRAPSCCTSAATIPSATPSPWSPRTTRCSCPASCPARSR